MESKSYFGSLALTATWQTICMNKCQIKCTTVVQGPFKGRVKITFVDGGTLSNFPIAHFHNRGVPLLPTFGARLSEDREDYSKTSNLLELFHAMNDASRCVSLQQMTATICICRTWLSILSEKSTTKRTVLRFMIISAESGFWLSHPTILKEVMLQAQACATHAC